VIRYRNSKIVAMVNQNEYGNLVVEDKSLGVHRGVKGK
jgi:hypothetical protein